MGLILLDSGAATGVARNLDGTVTGSTTVTAALKVAHALSATSAGTATVSAPAPKRNNGLFATSPGVTTVSGSLITSTAFAGTVNGVTGITVTLNSTTRIAATSAGKTTSTGSLVVAQGYSATAHGTTTVSGSIRLSVALAALITGASGVSGSLRVLHALSGTSAGDTGLSAGTVIAGNVLTGDISSGSTTVTAILRVAHGLAATSTGANTTVGDLAVVVAVDLIGSVVAGRTVVSGALSGGTAVVASVAANKLRILEDALRTLFIDVPPARTPAQSATRFAQAYVRYAGFLRANGLAPTLTGAESRRLIHVLTEGFSSRNGAPTQFALTLDKGLRSFWQGVHFGSGALTSFGTRVRKGLATLPVSARTDTAIKQLASVIHTATLASIVTFPMPGGPVPLL